MYPVGGSQGQTWNFNEGQGEATILKTPLTDNYISNEVLLQSRERKEQAKKDADDFQKRIDAMNTAYQSADIEAQHALREGVMDYISDVSDYRAKTGKNPLLASSVDPDSKKYQDGYQQLMALPQMAKQLTTEIKGQIDLYKANPEKYLADENLETLQKGLSDGQLQRYLSGQDKVPSLQLKAPTVDVIGGLSKGLTGMGVDLNNSASVTAGTPLVVESLLAGPDKEKYENSASQAISRMSPEYQDALKKRAEESGVSPIAQYMVEVGNSLADTKYTFDSRENDFYEKAKQKVAIVTTDTYSGPKVDEALRLMKEYAEADPKFMADLERKGMTLDQWSKGWGAKKVPWGPTSSTAPKDDNENGGGGDTNRMHVEDRIQALEKGDALAQGIVANYKFPGNPSVKDILGNTVAALPGTFVSVHTTTKENENFGGKIQPGESVFKIQIRVEKDIDVPTTKAGAKPELRKDSGVFKKEGGVNYQIITVGREEAIKILGPAFVSELKAKQGQSEAGQASNTNVNMLD
jgi:hypothetical protein